MGETKVTCKREVTSNGGVRDAQSYSPVHATCSPKVEAARQ